MTKRKLVLFQIFIIFLCLIFNNFVFEVKMSADAIYTRYSVQRLAGADRYETSVLLSKSRWNSTTDNVVLATGEDFPDALCAGPLAAKLNAPILLTKQNLLNSCTKNEITRLNPKNVYIIGQPDTISLDVENEINNMNINTIRVAGKDRYETSLKIANLMGNCNTIFVVGGQNFPDAISIAAIAAKQCAPIILTNKDNISQEFTDYLSNNHINQSYVIGGQATVSNNVINQIPNCARIAGKDRYETNAEVLTTFSNEFNLSSVYMTTGENFPDAVSCSALAGLNSTPIILINKNKDANLSFKAINSYVKNINVLGGEAIVPNRSIEAANEDANAKNALKIPTYDGSGQACHPKVLYFPKGWNGFKFWMTMTPYPDGNDLDENPSIVVSNSGTDWKVPKGLTNPITSPPDQRGKHNSDPHLVFNEDKNQLELWYRYTAFNKLDNVYRVTSTDGVNWSRPQRMISFYNQQKCLSPSVILEDNKYKMWYINQDYKCMYIESSDEGVRWTNPVEVKFNLAAPFVPWHMDIVHTDLGYEVIFCGARKEELNLNNRILYRNVSKDGIHFGNSAVILRPSINDIEWDNKQIYRSSFVKVDGIYKLFYSAMDKKNKWHIGLSQGNSLGNLHGM